MSLDYLGKLQAAFPSAPKPMSMRQVHALTEPLTRNELSLLRFLREGAANKQIAEALNLSEGTVKVYLSRLYEKLGVSSRTQALAAAQQLQLLD